MPYVGLRQNHSPAGESGETQPPRSGTFSRSDGYVPTKHEGKKFHDPAAAVCMLHPEAGTWVNGTLYRERGGWGTRVSDDPAADEILADIDRTALWNHIATFT